MILFSDAQKSVKKQASEEGRETSGTEEETDCKLPPLTLHAGNCFHGIYDCLFVTSHLGGGGGEAQWLSGRVLHTRSKGCGVQASTVSLCCCFEHWSLLSTGSSLGCIAQSVMCLATDACLTADPGIASSSWPGTILSWRLIINYFLRSFSSLPLEHSRRVVVSYKQKNVHEVLVNSLFKLAQEKSVVR